jgi:hypothetical protein
MLEKVPVQACSKSVRVKMRPNRTQFPAAAPTGGQLTQRFFVEKRREQVS